MSDFNRIAPYYDFLARLVFGESIKKAQINHFHLIQPSHKVLIIGGGTGWILEDLFRNCTPQKVVYCEASSQMIAIARKRIMGRSYQDSIEFVYGETTDYESLGEFDIVITNFYLDLYKGSQLLFEMRQILAALKANSYWLFTDFEVANDAAWWKKRLIHLMYFFFKITCGVEPIELPYFKEQFEKLPLKEISSKYFFKSMIRSAAYVSKGM